MQFIVTGTTVLLLVHLYMACQEGSVRHVMGLSALVGVASLLERLNILYCLYSLLNILSVPSPEYTVCTLI